MIKRKSQVFAIVEPSNYVGIASFLIEYSISMEVNENLPIWTDVANRRGNDTRFSINTA